MRGIRTRLTLTLLALVAVTVTAIGVGTYVFVEGRLREGLLADVSRRAQFDLSVLLPGTELPPDPTPADIDRSGLPDALRLRGDSQFILDTGNGDPYIAPTSIFGIFQALPPDLRANVDAGRLGYVWLPTADGTRLVVGGRQGAGPALYLVVDATPVDAALSQLRFGLIAAAFVAIVVALVLARLIARRILRPIASGSVAASRIAAGDFGARLPIDGRDEFAAWAAEFNRMADSLQATVASLETAQQQNRRFVADVSHELRTPLTALVAEASLIEQGLDQLEPDARRAAELLVADVRRLRVLVDDLMELSRFDAQAESLRLEPVDLGRVVTAIVASRLPAAEVSLPPRPLVVESDVRRIDRILGNLLDNARTHAPDAPVRVVLEDAGPIARIVVEDRGPGVSPDALEHLFDRFYKADPSRATGESSSSGLGLAIAAEHAALLGGSLTADSREGGGLRFRVTIPVTRPLPGGDGADSDGTEALPLLEPTARQDR